MDYIGSKSKLNDWIFSILYKYIEFSNKDLCFLDACAGTGSVSEYAAKLGFNKIVSNDLMNYSYCVTYAKLNMNLDLVPEAIHHIQTMNSIEPVEGFFLKNYSESGGRLYFTVDNAAMIDACRIYIDKILNPILKNYLLYCLLEAVSRISNTSGTYGAFLKKIKPRALARLELKLETFFTAKNSVVFQEDILTLLKGNFRFKEDIIYIDPPYNERQYGANYHIYETLIKYDNPNIKGITGLRDWTKESKSDFCTKMSCLSFLEEIIINTRAELILLSYSSDGLMSKEEVISMVEKMNKYEIIPYEKEYKRYKADNERNNRNDILYEYLFVFKLDK